MLTKRITITLAALLFSHTVSAANFNVDSLLTKSVGGPKAVERLRTMKNIVVRGKVSINDQPGTFLEFVCPPDNLYLEVTLDAYQSIQAYDGSTAWQSDLNGRVSELSGFEKRELIKSAYFETASYIVSGRMTAGKRYEGIITREGKPYHQVAFSFFDSDTVRVLFDTGSGYAIYRLSRLDNTPTVSQSFDFHQVDAVNLPFKSSSTATGAPLVVEFTTDSVRFDQSVDPTIFHMPATGVEDVHFPSDSNTVTIPVEYRSGHLYVVATINGKRKGKFILDSGCSASIFHLPFVESMNLTKAGTMPAKGVGGFESVDLLKSDSITIGPVSLYHVIGGATDLSAIGSDDTMSFAGILGYDFLSRFPILISYRSETVTLFRAAQFTPPAGGTSVPFDLTMQVPTVKGTIAGISGQFIIDLGNANGLLLHDAFIRQNGLAAKLLSPGSSPHSMSGVGGGVVGTHTTVPKFSVGDFTFRNVPTVLSTSTVGMTGSEAIAGNIGNQVLDQVKVLLDYQNSRIIFY